MTDPGEGDASGADPFRLQERPRFPFRVARGYIPAMSISCARSFALAIPALVLLACRSEPPDEGRATDSSAVAPAPDGSGASSLREEDGLEAPMESRDLSKRICADSTVSVPGRTLRLMAVCHRVPEASHAEGGSVDFLVYARTDSGDILERSRTGVLSGGFGQPGNVGVLQLGPGAWGFSLVEAFSGQGETIETTTWFKAAPDGISEILGLESESDNAGGECAFDSSVCVRMVREATLDSAGGRTVSGLYSVVLADSSFRAGKLATRLSRLVWVDSSGSWAVPDPPGLPD